MQKKVNKQIGENNAPSLNPSRPQFGIGSECLGRVCLQWRGRRRRKRKGRRLGWVEVIDGGKKAG